MKLEKRLALCDGEKLHVLAGAQIRGRLHDVAPARDLGQNQLRVIPVAPEGESVLLGE